MGDNGPDTEIFFCIQVRDKPLQFLSLLTKVACTGSGTVGNLIIKIGFIF